MSADKSDEHDDECEEVGDGWDDFRGGDGDPIGVAELEDLDLKGMPEDVRIYVMDDYFPETTISRHGDTLICEIQEHLYTKYWEHKFSAYAFAEAMERAVRRLGHEGHPVVNPTRDDEDVHIFVHWDLNLPASTLPEDVAESIKAAFDLVWHRADSILENSDSVLILGKDTGAALETLKRIAAKLQEMGYYGTDQRLGASFDQKGGAVSPDRLSDVIIGAHVLYTRHAIECAEAPGAQFMA